MIGDFNLPFWLHMLALSAAGSALFGELIVKAHLDDHDPKAIPILARFEAAGGLGFGLLILTGGLMIWLNGFALRAMGGWFWTKMTLLVLAFVAAALQARLGARARAGDAAAARRETLLDWTLRGLFAAVIPAAVMTFH